MQGESHNGWTNYTSWNVVLWIDNEESLYTRKNQWLRKFSGRINARLAEEIAEDCLGGSKTPDLKADDESIGYCWKDINWTKVAFHWSDEYE